MQQSRSNTNMASQHVSSFTRLAKQTATLQGTSTFKHKPCLVAPSATLALAIPQVMSCHTALASKHAMQRSTKIIQLLSDLYGTATRFLPRVHKARKIPHDGIIGYSDSRNITRNVASQPSLALCSMQTFMKQQGRAKTNTAPKPVSYFTRRTTNMAILQELISFRLEPSPDFPRE